MMTTCLLLLLLAAAPDAGTKVTLKRPVTVRADVLKVFDKERKAVGTGNARAQREGTDIQCDRMEAHYTQTQEVTHLTCIGNVEMKHGTKWAKGERADFDNTTGVLVMKGSPEARDGKNHLRGSVVIFDSNRDVLEVKDARVVFEPKRPSP